jgi:hypothetical protein
MFPEALLTIKKLVLKRIVAHRSGSNEITLDEIGEINDHIQMKWSQCQYYYGCW